MGAASTSSKNTNPASTSTQEAVNARAMRAALPYPYHRLRVGLTLAVSAIAILAFAMLLVAAFEWRSHPFFGAMLNPNMVVDGSTSITDTSWPGLQAGLARLDHVTAINGDVLAADSRDYYAARTHFRD